MCSLVTTVTYLMNVLYLFRIVPCILLRLPSIQEI